MTLGEKLSKLRRARMLTQEKVGADLGISQKTISGYEKDIRRPSVNMLQRLADYYGVGVSSLMPGGKETDSEFAERIADSLHKNPKLGLLFDRSRSLSESDLDAVLSIVNAISKERG